jgi:hypothetical protein
LDVAGMIQPWALFPSLIRPIADENLLSGWFMKAEVLLKLEIDIKEETYYYYLVFEIIKLIIL